MLFRGMQYAIIIYDVMEWNGMIAWKSISFWSGVGDTLRLVSKALRLIFHHWLPVSSEHINRSQFVWFQFISTHSSKPVLYLCSDYMPCCLRRENSFKIIFPQKNLFIYFYWLNLFHRHQENICDKSATKNKNSSGNH